MSKPTTEERDLIAKHGATQENEQIIRLLEKILEALGGVP